mgnify:CR=1 FL=1
MLFAYVYTFCENLYYRAAADNDVAVVHNDRLALGNRALRLVEDELEGISIGLDDGCPLLLLMVTDACLDAARLCDSVAVDEVDVFGGDVSCEEALVRREDDSVSLGVNLFDIHRLRQSQT